MKLQEKYNNEVKSSLNEKFNYKSVMQLPQVNKIVVNMGVGDATTDSKRIDTAFEELKLITGQAPVKTLAKKSNAYFKIREGMPLGLKVTLRGENMWMFLEKLINVTLPRVRDFRGLNNTSFDGRGNFTFGLKEQLVFPEITFDQVSVVRGMDISIVTTAKSDEEAKELLLGLGLPIKK